MAELILAAVFLLASHFGISSTGLRRWLVQRLGASLYLVAYSILALIAFICLALAYWRADVVVIWQNSPWQGWLVLLLMPMALLLLIGALSSPNPTVAGNALKANEIAPPEGIMRITRHPTMWAFGFWALGHLLANGDLASLVLFGTITILALAGTKLIDARYRRRLGALWDRYEQQTSNIPFVAIIDGRQRLRLDEIGLWRPMTAFGLFALMLLGHDWLIGVPPFIST